ncbi:helix-turn-helix domain-containing protein [Maricaulis virginensis]|uniref:Transcriptional regulator n=1 Tax=Maricaulis virginensis TaxID=144022 RepID=A0A9W6MN65_9PROT|nr:helix-turn-helix domain-containing protein [Maricaulis virginensis]GLK52270.1 transcriptional regulator [Maricaulis virginensis]
MLNATLPTDTRHCAVSALRCIAAEAGDPLAKLFENDGATAHFRANDEIFAEEEAADAVYRVTEGVARICKFTEDGRRQIGEFHFSGDVFGLEYGSHRSVCAEAVTDCRVSIVGRAQLLAKARRDGELANALWRSSCDALHRMHEQLFLLGRANAADRVLAFFHMTAERLNSRGVVEIPMSRQDIADHLGLNIETVSRTITQLRGEGAIRLEGARRVCLDTHDRLYA